MALLGSSPCDIDNIARRQEWYATLDEISRNIGWFTRQESVPRSTQLDKSIDVVLYRWVLC